MRLLWHSVDPRWGTGYGTQTSVWVPRIASLGYEVAISAFAGAPQGLTEWRGHPVYPGGDDRYGADRLADHAKHFGADLVITLMDAYALDPEPWADKLAGRVAQWMPIDADDGHGLIGRPISFLDHMRLLQSAAQPIAMSRYGDRQLRLAGHRPFFVPHGIDCQVFRPPEDKAADKAAAGLEGQFVIGINATNIGNLNRKAWPEQLAAFAKFHRRHPDTVLLAHTVKGAAGKAGLNLGRLVSDMGLAGAVRFTDEYSYKAGLISQAQIAATYGLMDLYSGCTMAEGFGLPVMEAQACFPSETPVTATRILRGMKRSYTGELISVTTARGDVVEATSEHPFWTKRGWIPAGQLRSDDQLLYTGGHAKIGIPQVHAGTIGDIVGSLHADALEGSRRANGAALWRGVLAGAPARPPQVSIAEHHHAPGHGNLRADRLHGWSDRRGGYGLHPRHGGQAEPEASHPDRQLVRSANGLAARNVLGSVDLPGTAAATGHFGHALHVPYRRSGIPAPVRGAAALPGHQASSDGMPHRVLQGTARTEQARSPESSVPGDGGYRSQPEYQAIQSISRRIVRSLPVYNLTTASSTYTAAGYLVHNCGVPTVVTDGSAMSEVGCGWKVRGEPYFSVLHHAYWRYPRPDDILRAYEKAYLLWKRGVLAAKGAEARQHALSYDADRVLTEHWKPVLAELEARCG